MIPKEQDEGFVADKVFGAMNGVAEAFPGFLAHIGDTLSVFRELAELVPGEVLFVDGFKGKIRHIT